MVQYIGVKLRKWCTPGVEMYIVYVYLQAQPLDASRVGRLDDAAAAQRHSGQMVVLLALIRLF